MKKKLFITILFITIMSIILAITGNIELSFVILILTFGSLVLGIISGYISKKRSQKLNKPVFDFIETFKDYEKLDQDKSKISEKYFKNIDRYNAILNKRNKIIINKEREKYKKLCKECLDILTETKGIVERKREKVYEQSNVISVLQEKVIKIENLEKKKIAQEIKDVLWEMSNLNIEIENICYEEIEYLKINDVNSLSIAEGIIKNEDAIKKNIIILKKMGNLKEKRDKISDVIILLARLTDLAEKMDEVLYL